MNNSKKLAELTDLTPVQNPEEVKGGFFFLSLLFGGYHAPAYQPPPPVYQAPAYQAPKTNYSGSGKSGKKH